MTEAAAFSQSREVFPYHVDVKDFSNGLKLVGVRFDSPGLAAYYSVVRVGSRHEVEKGRTGFAHFFEHMMFRGTESYPEEKYNEVLRSMGADSNAYTSSDRTVYHILASSRSLPRIVEIESDRFQNLKYSKEQFQKEAGAVLGEYNKSAANPFMALYEKLQETAYDVHPYQHMTIGFLEDIRAMPEMYEYSLEFFRRFYRPEYVTLLVVGDYDWDELSALVEQHYGDWERGGYAVDIPQRASASRGSRGLGRVAVAHAAAPRDRLQGARIRCRFSRHARTRRPLPGPFRRDLASLSEPGHREAMGGFRQRGRDGSGRPAALHHSHPRAGTGEGSRTCERRSWTRSIASRGSSPTRRSSRRPRAT